MWERLEPRLGGQGKVVGALRSFWGGGEATGDEEGDNFRTWVARGIVVVSILGALVSWQASESSEDADDYDQQALRERNFEELARDGLRASLTHDLRLLGEFEESWKTNDLIVDALESQPESQSLQVDLLRELRRHQTLRRFFNSVDPSSLTTRRDTVAFDPDYVADFQESTTPALNELRPDEAQAAGQDAHARTVNYVRAAAMFAASLFFLTLAALTSQNLRGRMALVGSVVTAAAIAQYALA